MRPSQGFRLVVNGTHPAHDFPANPVNGLNFFSARSEAKINYVSVTSTGGAVFFSASAILAHLSTDYLPTGLVSGPAPDTAHVDSPVLTPTRGLRGSACLRGQRPAVPSRARCLTPLRCATPTSRLLSTRCSWCSTSKTRPTNGTQTFIWRS